MNLVVLLRVYPGVSKRPLVYSESKLAMWEFTLNSLRVSLARWQGEVRVEILFDACPNDFVEAAEVAFSGMNLKCHRLGRTGNAGTFLRQLEIASALDGDEYVYLAEDDYYYLPDAFTRAQQFLHRFRDVRFLTLYDHPDVNDLEVHRGRHPLRKEGEQTWRRDYSTCCSFLAQAGAIRERFTEFSSFCRGNTDCGMWLSLTRAQVFFPWRWAACYFRGGWDQLTYVMSAWRYCSWSMLTTRAEDLWAATPGLATHLESTGIGTDRNWKPIVIEAARAHEATR